MDATYSRHGPLLTIRPPCLRSLAWSDVASKVSRPVSAPPPTGYPSSWSLGFLLCQLGRTVPHLRVGVPVKL